MALLEPAPLIAEDIGMGFLRSRAKQAEIAPPGGLDHFRAALAAGDWAAASHLWAEHRLSMMLSDPVGCDGIVAGLPVAVAERYPVLRVAAATTVASGTDAGECRVDTLRSHTDACRRAVEQHGDELESVELAYIGAGHVAGLRISGRPDASEEFGAVLVRRLTSGPGGSVVTGPNLAWVYLQWGVTATLQGEVTAATTRFEKAWEHGRGPGVPPHVAANAAANLALIHAVQGNTFQAEEWLALYRALDVTGPWQYMIGVGAEVAAGLLALDRGDVAAAADAVAYFDVSIPTVELWPFVAYVTVCHSLAFGHPADAVAALDEAVRTHSPLPAGGFAGILLASARAHALTGVEICQRAEPASAEAGPDRAVLDLSLSRLHFLAGQYDHAAALGPAGTGPLRRRGQAKLAALAAVARTRRREPDPLRSGEALALIQRSHAVHALLSEPDCDPSGVRKLEAESLTAEVLGRQKPENR